MAILHSCQNAKATTENESAAFANSDPKICYHGNVPRDRAVGKKGQIDNLRSNIYYGEKFGENLSSRS